MCLVNVVLGKQQVLAGNRKKLPGYGNVKANCQETRSRLFVIIIQRICMIVYGK